MKDQFGNEVYTLRCKCGCHTYMSVVYDEELGEHWFTLMSQPNTVWERIKLAVKLIFRGDVCYDEVIVPDVTALTRFLNDKDN